MTIVCWGNLAKSANDTARIEQSIGDYVEAHDENPNAHMGEDYSLGAHRLEAVLDHLDYSIVKSKLALGIGGIQDTYSDYIYNVAPAVHEAWTDIDLTGKVPAGTKAVFIQFTFYNEGGPVYIIIRKKGETGISKQFYSQAESEKIGDLTGLLGLDANYKCQYYFELNGAGDYSADWISCRLMGYI